MQISVVVDTGQGKWHKKTRARAELIHIGTTSTPWTRLTEATSMVGVVRTQPSLWDGDPAFYAVPDTHEGIAQQLLLFTMQGGSGDAFWSPMITKVAVTARMKTLVQQPWAT